MKGFVALFILIIVGCKNSQLDSAIWCDQGLNGEVKKIKFTPSSIGNEDGRTVQIIGYFVAVTEGLSLHPNENYQPENALTLQFENDEMDFESLSRKKVVIVGKVNLKRHGHFNMYMAGLDSVICIREIKPELIQSNANVRSYFSSIVNGCR